LRNWRDIILALGAGTLLFFRGNPILAIIAAGAFGMLLYRGVNLPINPTQASSQTSAHQMLRPVLVGLLAAGTALAVLFLANRRLFDLAVLMGKADLFAFGGGYASVPVMLHQVVDVRHWMDDKTFMDGIALGQVTPGPIVITATFVGYQLAGLSGAVVGTVAIFSPSFLIVLITVPYFDRLQHSLLFRQALRGILASFVGLLLAVTVQFALEVAWTVPSTLLALASFVALWRKVDIMWVVLVGAGLATFVL